MRKSRKVIFLTFWSILSISTLFAQNLSVYVSGGYGLPRGEDFWNSSMTYNDAYELTHKEDHYMSIGKGIQIEGGVIHPLHSKVNLRIAGVYNTMSPELVVERRYQSDNEVDSDTYSAKWMGGRLDVLFAHPFERITSYAGVGCGLFFAELKRQGKDYITDQSLFQDEAVYRFHPALGLNGFLGVSKNISLKVSVFMEFYFQQMSFLAKEYEMLKAERDGISTLDEIDLNWEKPGNQTIQSFKKNSIKGNAPEVVQGSSCGIKAGIRIHLGDAEN